MYRSGNATPDPVATPGAAIVGVTTAQVCERTWNADHKTISYPVQNAASREYGVIAGPGTTMHLDQLIPASLGGDAILSNVWPQPFNGSGHLGFQAKNELETHMHQLVCRGQLSLSTAQQAIATNWLAARSEYLSVPVTAPH